jgi:hypothetical protein
MVVRDYQAVLFLLRHVCGTRLLVETLHFCPQSSSGLV